MGERLDVLDECRAAVDATLVWSRRDRGGPGIAGVDVMDGGGLLAGDVCRGSGDDLNGSAARGETLGGGPLDRVEGSGQFTTDIEHDPVGTDRLGREFGTIEDEVRPGRHDRPVLGTQRLAFGSVRENDGSSAATSGDRRPLPRDREAGAAASQQPARLEGRDEAGRLPGVGSRAESMKMVGERLGAGRQRRTGEQSAGHQRRPWLVGLTSRWRGNDGVATTSGRPALTDPPDRIRMTRATSTAATHPPTIAIIHGAKASLPA